MFFESTQGGEPFRDTVVLLHLLASHCSTIHIYINYIYINYILYLSVSYTSSLNFPFVFLLSTGCSTFGRDKNLGVCEQVNVL